MELPIARFILILAAVFNDLKGAWYVVERLRDAQPMVDKSHAWRGQHTGMGLQNVRLIAGILHELMNVIDKHREVVDSSDFQHIVALLPAGLRTAWRRVRRIALKEDRQPNATSADSQLLLRIRNNVAFHYDPTATAKSYAAFFARPTLPFRDKAVLSDGDSMEASRFYFADAMMEEGLRFATGLSNVDLQRKLSAISRDVNFALKFIVVRYITENAKLSRYAPRP